MRKVFSKKRNVSMSSKNLFGLLLFLIISILSISCNDLPADLQAKRKACMVDYDKLLAREDTVKRDWEYDRLIIDYTKLSNDVISYTAESKKRGISVNNDELLKGIDQRIASFKGMLETYNKYNNETTSNSSSSSYSSSKSCSWCGKSFSGTHYTHLGKMQDCYSTNSSTSIGIYCSKKCCSEARRSSCPTCR